MNDLLTLTQRARNYNYFQHSNIISVNDNNISDATQSPEVCTCTHYPSSKVTLASRRMTLTGFASAGAFNRFQTVCLKCKTSSQILKVVCFYQLELIELLQLLVVINDCRGSIFADEVAALMDENRRDGWVMESHTFRGHNTTKPLKNGHRVLRSMH